MKKVKLKLAYEELHALHRLCAHYTGIVAPATERIRTGGHFGAVGVTRMTTSILCQRISIFLAKRLVEPKRLYYNLSIPPEYAGAALLAYWACYADMQPDVLLEAMFRDIHQQLA